MRRVKTNNHRNIYYMKFVDIAISRIINIFTVNVKIVLYCGNIPLFTFHFSVYAQGEN